MSEQEAMREVFEAFAQQETGRDIAYHERNHTTGIEFAWSAWQAALQWAAEGQEPVAYQYRCKSDWSNTGWSHWNECCKENADDFRKTPYLHGWTYETRALYAAPVPNTDLLAEVERLRKALAPFAALAEHYPTDRKYGNRPTTGTIYEVSSANKTAGFAVEDLHAAKAALAKGE